MQLHVREVLPDDAKTIADFNSRMAAETEGRPLDPGLIDPGVESVLADSDKGRYRVAEVEGEVVGQIMATYAWSDRRNGRLWWIQSVYMHED